MNLNFQAGASPLQARGNFIIYAVVIAAALVIGVFFLLWLWKNIKDKKKEDPKWIEEQKKRLTKKSDIIETCKKYNFKSSQAGILAWLCKRFQIPNICWTIKDFSSLEDFFKQGYLEIKNLWPAQKINDFFRLRFDVEKISAMSSPTSSTHALPLNHNLTLVLENGSTSQCKIAQTTKDNLFLFIPKDFFESKEKPAELSKIAFSFVSPSGLPYVFISRVIRYETNEAGENLLIIPHSTNLIPKAQRHYKRINISEKCKIASVQTKKTKKANGPKIYVESEKKIECSLLNISGGGCCINTTLPIKEGQNIYIELKLNSKNCNGIGKIVKTRKSKVAGTYNLHVKFIQLSTENQNTIYERIYEYDT